MESPVWRTWEQLGAESWDRSGGVYPPAMVSGDMTQYGHHDEHLQQYQSGMAPDQMQIQPMHFDYHSFHPSHQQFAYHHQSNNVARRNERERNRVRFINKTFSRLRQHLPCSEKKKLSKVDTLRTAIKYIKHLKHILEVQDQEESGNGSDVDVPQMADSTSDDELQHSPERLCPALPGNHGNADEDDSCSSFQWRSRTKSGSVTSGTDYSLDLEDDLDSEKHSSASSPVHELDDRWL